MTNQLLEDLQATKMVLITDGWCQGTLHKQRMPSPGRKATQHCILGAINVAVGGVNAGVRASRVGTVIAKAAGAGMWYSSIPSWNDTPGRTFTQVIEAINTAIRDADGDFTLTVPEEELLVDFVLASA